MNKNKEIQLIENPDAIERINYKPSVAVQHRMDMYKAVANHLERPNERMNVLFDVIPDNDDDELFYPVHQEIIVPGKYFMNFETTSRLLSAKANNVTMIDMHVFMYITDNFAGDDAFVIADPFWTAIGIYMEELGHDYKKNSLLRSIAKLVKIDILKKSKKAVYSINKVFIYQGPLGDRPMKIKQQFINQARAR